MTRRVLPLRERERERDNRLLVYLIVNSEGFLRKREQSVEWYTQP